MYLWCFGVYNLAFVVQLEVALSAKDNAVAEELGALKQRVAQLEENNKALVEREMLQRKYMIRLSGNIASGSGQS